MANNITTHQMPFIDYYKILGLDKTATEADIKKAYRKLARKHHPDLNPGDAAAEKKFKELNEANEVLSNKANRKKYDQYGKDWKHADDIEKQRQQQKQYQQAGRAQGAAGSFDEGDFSEYFQSMFGGSGGGQRGGRSVKYKGQDVVADMQIELIDALNNNTQVIQVGDKKIRFTIPAGIEDGQSLRLKGKGGQGMNGGPNGDLIITFHLINNTAFTRSGATLYSTVPIDLYTALLGGHINIDTLHGSVKLKVAPETPNGKKVKVASKGFAKYKKEGDYGDLIITYEIILPTKLTDEEIALFTTLKNLRTNG